MTAKKNALSSTGLTPVEGDPLKRDFRNFLFIAWEHLETSSPPTPVQYDIARFLQHGPRRSIIMSMRGIGKSWITVAYVAWLLYCDPQHRVLVVSASGKAATDFTTMLLALIMEMEILAFLRPRDGQRTSRTAFDVGPARTEKAPSVQSLGVTGQLTGARADTVIPDDIETATNSDTQASRDKLFDLVREFDNVLKPGGAIKYLGTPHTEDSLYNKLAERGYVTRIWPARYPAEAQRAKYGARLAPVVAQALDKDPTLAGKAVDTRLNEEVLLEKEMANGRSGFTLQFMLDTSLSDADRFPLRLKDLIVLPLDPLRGPVDLVYGQSNEQVINDLPNVGIPPDRFYGPAWIKTGDYAAYEQTVMFIDPSGRGKDETTYAVIKSLHGRLFLIAAGGSMGGYEEHVLDKLLHVARRTHVNLILVEPNFGDGMFAKLLQARAVKVHPCQIDDAKWSKMQKERRIIDTLEPLMNQHKLVVDRAVIESDFKSTENYPTAEVNRRRLFYQLTRITRDKGSLRHDDRIDALAGAAAYFVDQMNRDTEDAAIAHRDSLLENEIEKFIEHATGGKSDGTRPARPWASGVMRRNHSRV